MSGVRGVLNYAGCFAKAVGNVERINGWEPCLQVLLVKTSLSLLPGRLLDFPVFAGSKYVATEEESR